MPASVKTSGPAIAAHDRRAPTRCRRCCRSGSATSAASSTRSTPTPSSASCSRGQDVAPGARRAGARRCRRVIDEARRAVLGAGRAVRGPLPGRVDLSRPGRRAAGAPATCHGRRPDDAPDDACPTCCSLPATLFLCVFFLYPFVLVAVEAFTRDGVTDRSRTSAPWRRTGSSRRRFRNTLLLAAVVVPIQLALALAMASIVTELERGPQRHPLHLRHPARHLRPRRRAHLARDLRAVRLPQHAALIGLGVIDRPITVPRLPEHLGRSSSPSSSPRSGGRRRS